MNNDQEIILAKISAVYDKPPFVKMETGQMEMILKCVGLGAYYDKYREYLEPYWYNGRFQNPVESYRIFVGLNSIFEDLLNERKGDEIISLLTEYLRQIYRNSLKTYNNQAMRLLREECRHEFGTNYEFAGDNSG